MTNFCILVAGPNISSDSSLLQKLGDDVTLLKTEDYSAVMNMLEKRHVDILLLEVIDSRIYDISLISKAKQIIPDLQVIIVNGDDIAGAFVHGATDAFSQPYERDLLVERVRALLRRIPDV